MTKIPKNKKIRKNLSVGEAEKATNLEDILFKEFPMVVDFSSPTAFKSVDCQNFNNYLKNSNEFLDKTRELVGDLQKLANKTSIELFSNGGFRHCHELAKDQEKRFETIMRKIWSNAKLNENDYDQLLGSERIYQIGLNSPIRLFGTRKGNVFRVYLIDFFHEIEQADRYNERNLKNYELSIM